MVPLPKRRHLAPEHNPERELRQLWFATNTSTSTSSTPADWDDGQVSSESQNGTEHAADTRLLANMTVADLNNIIRNNVQTILTTVQTPASQSTTQPSTSNSATTTSTTTDADATATSSTESTTAATATTATQRLEGADGQSSTLDHTEVEGDAKKSPEDVLIDGAKDMRHIGMELLETLKNKENLTLVHAAGIPNFEKQWKDDSDELDAQMSRVAGDKAFVEAIQKLNSGGNPDEFMSEIREWANGEGYGCDEFFHLVANIVEKVCNANRADINQWETLNKSTKTRICREILDAGAIKTLIGKMTDMHKSMKETLEKSKKAYDENVLLLKNEVTTTTQKSLSEKLMQVRFYSINDVWHGMTEYYEALKHSWEHTRHTKSAAVADAIGNAMDWLPFYGKETALQLNQNIRSKNRENTGKEKERLKESNASWTELFGPNGHHGLLHEYLHGANYDNARAVMEYAASRGWLYDLDESMTTPTKTVFGVPLSDICTDWNTKEVANYYTTLRQQNSGGRDDEIANAKKKISDNRNVPLFISEIEREMDDLNIWAAAGICERAMERGLEGEISPWLTTAVLGKLRDNPMLRKITNDYFFDKVGKMSMYTTAPTLGWFKANGRALTQWCQLNNTEYFNDTSIGRIILDIERLIYERSPEPRAYFDTTHGKKKLRHWTAKILAGQKVDLSIDGNSGKYISIFESKFAWYRDKIATTFASPAKPYEEDSDYYVGESEQWLMPENVIKKILAHQSTGEFHREDLAKPFITKLIKKAEDLRKDAFNNLSKPELMDAYNNYMTETRSKLDLWMSGLRSHQAGARIATTVLNDNRTPAIAAMYFNGLISTEILQSAPAIWKIIQEEQLIDKTIFPDNAGHIFTGARLNKPAAETGKKAKQPPPDAKA